MRKIKKCKSCGKKLPHQAHGLCKKCYSAWHYKQNADRIIAAHHANRQYKHKTNPLCPTYLGCHVAEQVLSKVFENVERMPPNYPGYDCICNRGMKIDIKSACMHKNRSSWTFNINKNTIADYFLCLAFDNRIDLTPLHLWLIPSNVLGVRNSISISKSTINKWKKYELNITQTLKCCDSMK